MNSEEKVRVTEKQVKEMKKLYSAGVKISQIARTYDLPIATVRYHLVGKPQMMIGKKYFREQAYEQIIFQGIYDYFKSQKGMNFAKFARLIYGESERRFTLKNFITGKNESYFQLWVYERICEVCGKSFEETFKRRK